MRDGKRKPEEDDILALVFAVFFLLAVISGALIRRFHLEPVFEKPCAIHRLTGWYCPGCGGTRALLALLRGEWQKSLRFHPLVGYGAAVITLFAASRGLGVLSRGRVPKMRWRTGYLWAGAGILAANFAVKNYYLLIKGIDLLDGG